MAPDRLELSAEHETRRSLERPQPMLCVEVIADGFTSDEMILASADKILEGTWVGRMVADGEGGSTMLWRRESIVNDPR